MAMMDDRKLSESDLKFVTVFGESRPRRSGVRPGGKASRVFCHRSERTENPDPFETKRLAHPEKLSRVLGVDVQGIIQSCAVVSEGSEKGCATRPGERSCGEKSFALP
jgi:hypothetical protein